MIQKTLSFSPVSESQNEYAKDEKRVRNDIFNSLAHSINNSLFMNYKPVPEQKNTRENIFFAQNPS